MKRIRLKYKNNKWWMQLTVISRFSKCSSQDSRFSRWKQLEYGTPVFSPFWCSSIRLLAEWEKKAESHSHSLLHANRAVKRKEPMKKKMLQLFYNGSFHSTRRVVLLQPFTIVLKTIRAIYSFLSEKEKWGMCWNACWRTPVIVWNQCFSYVANRFTYIP